MRATDVKPISGALNFHVDQDPEKGITWNFRMEPQGDSEISVTTGDPPRSYVRAAEMKDAVSPTSVDIVTDRVMGLLVRNQPLVPLAVLDQARPFILGWVQSQWRFFEWLHRDARRV